MFSFFLLLRCGIHSHCEYSVIIWENRVELLFRSKKKLVEKGFFKTLKSISLGFTITQTQYCLEICREKQQKLANIWRKMYFINELKYSKRSEQGTNDAMSLFCLLQKLSDRTLLSYELLLPCDETSTLYSLPTFSFMFLDPLNFECRTSIQLVISKCPTQPKLQICYLFLTW